MSAASLLTVALMDEADVVVARQRARQIAGLVGFEAQDQTRIATAVSEIARNAMSYGGGGRLTFMLDRQERAMLMVVRDHGPGIADVDAILEGRFKSMTGMGVGISGTRRLMDRFSIDQPGDGGLLVSFGKTLPRDAAAVSPKRLAEIGATLAATGAADPLVEARTQNQELLQSLAALNAKQEEAERLNAELEHTNRGVVALYAELDEKAAELSALNAHLEERVTAAVSECQQANETLRQAQKMEAVGQLTGGIAHDFNNLLQIVTGNLEMVGRRLPDGDERLARAVANAMSGAQRAATLTQRLLAFSRRQPLAPKPIDANRLVGGMSDLMRRTLGETITINTSLARDLWIVEADANQLENALLNLAVNARDAMPPGGTLRISTGNSIVGEAGAEEDAIPGRYVAVAVCDTGEGMSNDTLARVFEPFFTTKEVGRGTGLGLSMVYGFVKQSGGHLRIESALGRGTTVTIYLPRLEGAAVNDDVLPEISSHRAGNGEMILVVEDDPEVRAYSCDVLRELGYSVSAASDGPSALEIIDGGGTIDLLFTDVVLPGTLTGKDVADRLHVVRPGVPVLFTSGYAREAIGHQGRLSPDVELLTKPFTYAALAQKIGEALVRGRH